MQQHPWSSYPRKAFNLRVTNFPIRDTFLSCPALFPFALPFPFLFFDDTTCQPVRSMMIHGPFVICLISVDCLKQRVFGNGPLVFLPFNVRYFLLLFLYLILGHGLQKAESRKRGV